MTKINIKAARVKQGTLKLYTTSMRVKDLVQPGFYSVEKLDPTDKNDKGYQRLLNETRARRLADYIVRGLDTSDSFLPTSVFLATSAAIPYDSDSMVLSIDTSQSGPFSVVDGQHRLEGLRLAADRDARTLDFELPVNIAVELPQLHQMCHFLIVNSTQKSVDKSVEQRIVSRLSEALDVEDIPSLPRWIQKIVDKGEVDQAVKIVDFLNSQLDSPWYQKVKLPNTGQNIGAINQHSLVKSLVKYVLTPNNPLTSFQDSDKEKKAFSNYWKAIASCLDDGEDSVLFKYNGVEVFCRFSLPFFMKCQNAGSYSVDTMKSLLRACLDNVEGEYAGVSHPEWWSKGGTAGTLNSGALSVVAQQLALALNKPSFAGDFEL